MMNKKFLRKIIFSVIISGSFLFTPNVENFISTVHAEIKMFTGIGEGQMSEIETADIVKLRAREKAIKNAIDNFKIGYSSIQMKKPNLSPKIKNVRNYLPKTIKNLKICANNI